MQWTLYDWLSGWEFFRYGFDLHFNKDFFILASYTVKKNIDNTLV